MPDGSEPRIQLLLELLEEDRKHVMIYVGLCFAVPAFTLSDLRWWLLPEMFRLGLLVSLGSFITAGVCFFLYAQRIHWKRLAAIQSVMDLNADELRKEIFGPETGVWASGRVYYELGSNVLLLACITYMVFVIGLLLGPPPPSAVG